LCLDGELEDDEFIDFFISRNTVAENNFHRWFFESPLHESGRTWVLSKMWGSPDPRTLTSGPEPTLPIVGG